MSSYGFALPVDHRVKMKVGKKDRQILGHMRAKVIPIVVGVLNMVPKSLEKEPEELEINGTIKTIQTTTLLRSARILKSSGDLRRLAVTQTPAKSHQQTLVWKTYKEWNNNDNNYSYNNYSNKACFGKYDDPLRIVLEIKIWP